MDKISEPSLGNDLMDELPSALQILETSSSIDSFESETTLGLETLEERKLTLILAVKPIEKPLTEVIAQRFARANLEFGMEAEVSKQIKQKLQSIDFEREGFECDPASSKCRNKIVRVRYSIELTNGAKCKILFFKSKDKEQLLNKLSLSGTLSYLLKCEYSTFIYEAERDGDFIIIQATIGFDVLNLPTLIAFQDCM